MYPVYSNLPLATSLQVLQQIASSTFCPCCQFRLFSISILFCKSTSKSQYQFGLNLIRSTSRLIDPVCNLGFKLTPFSILKTLSSNAPLCSILLIHSGLDHFNGIAFQFHALLYFLQLLQSMIIDLPCHILSYRILLHSSLINGFHTQNSISI